MARTINMDMTRIEGHVEIETQIVNNRVEEARVKGKMFRGFEYLLKDRHPVDALRITQRVCGVCHEVHGIASALALEDLYGIEPPPNGKILRDMVLGLHLATDHLLHFYTLSSPDFVEFAEILKYTGKDPAIINLKNWVTNRGPRFFEGKAEGDYIKDTDLCLRIVADYVKALEIRSQGAKGIALLGARTPFVHALMPGGITTTITPDRLMNYRRVLDKVSNFVQTAYIPEMLEVVSHFKNYFDIGVSHNNFYANESFNFLGDPLFKSGVLINGQRDAFRPEFVREELISSYYDDDLRPNLDKPNAYSWTKSPRYKGQPMEVGPLARMMINQDPTFLSLMERFNAQPKSSVMARIVARAVETELICKHLYDLLDHYELGAPTIEKLYLSQDINGKGSGYSIAARGALIHHIEAANGKIKQYSMIVPSTWNFGPSTGGTLGVAEQALIGTPVEYGDENPVEVGRVVRSFDPCTACSIH